MKDWDISRPIRMDYLVKLTWWETTQRFLWKLSSGSMILLTITFELRIISKNI